MTLSRPEHEVVMVPAGEIALGGKGQATHVNVFAIAPRPITRREYASFAIATGAASNGPADDAPFRGAGWPDAVAYCRWLTVDTGRTWRLPDEREWEKAARLGLLTADESLAEWTNTWSAEDRARVLRSLSAIGERTFDGHDAGFRVVLGMTGR